MAFSTIESCWKDCYLWCDLVDLLFVEGTGTAYENHWSMNRKEKTAENLKDCGIISVTKRGNDALFGVWRENTLLYASMKFTFLYVYIIKSSCTLISAMFHDPFALKSSLSFCRWPGGLHGPRLLLAATVPCQLTVPGLPGPPRYHPGDTSTNLPAELAFVLRSDQVPDWQRQHSHHPRRQSLRRRVSEFSFFFSKSVSHLAMVRCEMANCFKKEH